MTDLEIFGKKIPSWLKNSYHYKNKEDYDFSSMEIPTPKLEKIKSLKCFKEILRAIKFWDLDKEYYPYEIWEYVLNKKNEEKLTFFLAKKHKDSVNKYFLNIIDGEFIHEITEKDPHVEALYYQGREDNMKYLLYYHFVMNGQLEGIKYLHDSGVRADNDVFLVALQGIGKSYVEIVIYLYESGIELPDSSAVTEFAYDSKNIEILAFLRENNREHPEFKFDEDFNNLIEESGDEEFVNFMTSDYKREDGSVDPPVLVLEAKKFNVAIYPSENPDGSLNLKFSFPSVICKIQSYDKSINLVFFENISNNVLILKIHSNESLKYTTKQDINEIELTIDSYKTNGEIANSSIILDFKIIGKYDYSTFETRGKIKKKLGINIYPEEKTFLDSIIDLEITSKDNIKYEIQEI